MRPLYPRMARPRSAVVAGTVALLCACGTSSSATRGTGAQTSAGAGDPPTRTSDPARAADPPRAVTAPVPVALTIDLAHPAAAVPGRFVGLSFEASTLDHFARFGAHGDLAALLRSLGPGIIRFGGISADTRAAWVDPLSPRPAWAGWTVTPQMLEGVARFAKRANWRVLLAVSLAHYDPSAAAREVAAAHAALGPYLAGVEIGNEPDSYAAHGLRSDPWGVAEYLGEVAAYRQAIAAITPGVAIVGPDVSGSRVFANWATAFAANVHPALLTGHHYPLGCHDAVAPSIPRLLSPGVRRAEGGALDRYQSLAAAAQVPFRLDETGSVSCGGRPGVSDTFAAALWALDISVRAMTTGLAGINFEGNVLHCNTYTPICAHTTARLNGGVLSPQPEWYALLMTRYLVGDRPLHVHIATAQANLDAAALLARDGAVHLVVVDDAPATSRPTALHVDAAARFSSARVLALTAPSLASHNHVTLGGTAVRSDGSWSAPRRLPLHRATAGTITVGIAPGSAALITLIAVHQRATRGVAARRAHHRRARLARRRRTRPADRRAHRAARFSRRRGRARRARGPVVSARAG